MAPLGRQTGVMPTDSIAATARTLDRLNHRLSTEIFDDIDVARAARAGNISRNTWISEAIKEKLFRERAEQHLSSDRRAHG